jgi:SRSO17 transposase
VSEGYVSKIEGYFESYKPKFAVYRNNVSEQAWSYLQGLLFCEKGKANMERMEEQDGGIAYHQYQHFLSNSPWSYEEVIKQVGQDASSLFEKEKEKTGKATGLIIDESSHVKKGRYSVAVSRQYAGSVGKVDNCQVAVYLSLCNDKRSSLIDEALFLPKEWVEDKERSMKAGIPESKIVKKTKPVLALELIDNAIANKITFDWVGGDGLYGHNYELGRGLDDRNLLFVLDVHKDQHIYGEIPRIFVAEKQKGRGRTPIRKQTLAKAMRVDGYAKGLDEKDWDIIRIRKTTKGWLKALMHFKEVWVWDGKEEKARKRILIIRKTLGKDSKITDTKYSLANGSLEDHSKEDLAFFQAQRYWVERNFDDGKNELGMSDYQVRGWKSWHHHHAIVFMAMLFMLKEQIDQELEYPLMSLHDARKMVIVLIAQTIVTPINPVNKEIERMKIRQSKRRKSMDWHFNNDSS